MKKDRIAEELKQMKSMEMREGIHIPVPHFFYIEKYGRRVEEQMNVILPELGRREWFLFQTDGIWKEGSILHHFCAELEKHAKLGREYGECVVIELDAEVRQREEFIRFLEYLKTKEEQISFLFTMKQSKDTVSAERCVEQYFFVRTVYAAPYTVEEQLDVIDKICKRYQWSISSRAVQTLRAGLLEKEWESGEKVACRLENTVCRVLYEAVLEGQMREMCLTSQMAQQFLEHIGKEITQKITIGFARGGYEYE
ncbi:MAG: hypothetical protein J6B10_07420 [Lachnospiraceae bacterium]|nr:hypothetical protein [Lachnospiraceae bacterium]